MLNQTPDILTVEECRALLRTSKNTILALLNSGEIEAFRIKKRWKIPKEALLEYIKNKL